MRSKCMAENSIIGNRCCTFLTGEETQNRKKRKKKKQTNKQTTKKKEKKGLYMFTLSDRRLSKPLVLSQTECSVVLFPI